MGDMLSQAEINALLGGDTGNDDIEDKDIEKSTESAETENAIVDDVSDEEKEIEEKSASVNNPNDIETDSDRKTTLTDEEKDILGEIGNISMGTSATTLYALLGEKVLITTPRVKVSKWKELAKGYKRPCVGIRVDYKEGIEGSNVLILKDADVKIIANLMMGRGVDEGIGEDLNDLDLSAISETMNQMVGSSATSLSSLVKLRIDIDTPYAFILDFNDEKLNENLMFEDEDIVCVAFRMQIDNIIDSEIMQVIPMKFAIDMVDIMKNDLNVTKAEQLKENVSENSKSEKKMAKPQPQPQPQPQPVSQQPEPQMQYYNIPRQQASAIQSNINAQPAQFQNFDPGDVMQQKENIGIIMDVPLEVTVELGRANKKIKEILEFVPGTIVELDKLAGEPIDILVNGKYVAKGEVVVIDENFGIRISEIIGVENRI